MTASCPESRKDKKSLSQFIRSVAITTSVVVYWHLICGVDPYGAADSGIASDESRDLAKEHRGEWVYPLLIGFKLVAANPPILGLFAKMAFRLYF